MASRIGPASGPDIPLQVVHPKPMTLNPRASRSSCRPVARRYSATTRDPGASDVFTQGRGRSPRCTARRATSPAATMPAGFDVFVQLVIAAMTMSPSPSGCSAPATGCRCRDRSGERR